MANRSENRVMAIITTRIRDLSGAAQVDPKKIETYIYVYRGELADPGPRLRQSVLNLTPRPIAMWSLN